MRKIIRLAAWGEILFILSLSLVTFFWTGPKEIIDGNDTTYPLRPVSFFSERLYQWNHTMGTGLDFSFAPAGLTWHGLQAFLEKTGASIYLNQKLFLFLLFNAVSFSFYFFIRLLLPKNRLARLAGVVFYCFNPYLFNLWGNIQSANLTAYVFLPLWSAFFLKAFSQPQKGLFWAVLAGLSSVMLSAFGMNPQVVFVLLVYFVFFLIFLFWDRVIKARVLKAKEFFLIVLVFSLSYLLFNSYWLVPEILGVLGGGFSLAIPDAGQLRGWLEFLSLNTKTLNVLRQQGEWTWSTFHRGEPNIPFAGFYRTNPLLIFLSFFAFLGSALALIKSKRNLAAFFGLILFLGLLFSMGTSFPWGYLYLFLTEKLKILSFIRSPWYKFTLLTALAEAVLIAFLVEWLSLKSKLFKGIALILILGQFIYAYPLITGEAFPSHFLIQPAFHFALPDYIWEAANFLESDKEEYKTIMLPREGYQDFYLWGMGASNQLLNLLGTTKPVLTEPSWTIMGDTSSGSLTAAYYDYLYQGGNPAAAKILAPLNVKYLIQKNDFFYDFDRFAGSPAFVNDRLKRQSGLTKVKEIGEWDIYEVDQKLRLPAVYPAAGLDLVEAEPYLLSSFFLLDPKPNAAAVSAGELKKSGERAEDEYLIAAPLERIYSYQPQPPYIRFSPKHPLYFYTRWKEKQEISKLENPLSRARMLAFYSGKRLAEFERSASFSLLDEYLGNLEEIKKLLDSLKEVSGQNKEDLQAIEAYLKTYQKQALSFSSPADKLEPVREKTLEVKNKISGLLGELLSTPEIMKYEATVSEEGIYELYLYNEGFCRGESAGVQAVVNGEKLSFGGKVLPDNWIFWPALKLKAGRNLIQMVLPPAASLAHFSSPGEIDMAGLDPGKSYLVSFNYRLEDTQGASLIISPPAEVKDVGGNKVNNTVEDLPPSSVLTGWETILPPAYDLGQTKIFFKMGAPPGANSPLTIENFRVIPFYQPKLVLKRQTGSVSPPALPEISFQKITPVSYRVKVNRAEGKFWLIFAENFHPGWQATIKQADGKSRKIAENKHLRVNGYANAWLVEETGDSEVLIQYQPQSLYRKLLIFSGALFALGLFFIIIRLLIIKRLLKWQKPS